MRNHQRRFALNYTTAPSIRDPRNNGEMLPIQLKLTESAKMYQRMLAGTIQANSKGSFRAQLPNILVGKNTDWLLWCVQISPQHLCLSYTHRNPVTGRSAGPLCEADSPESAQLTITAPLELMCDFTVPAVLDEPERCVRYHFRRCKYPESHLSEWCKLTVAETVGGVVQFRDNLDTPFLGICDAEPD